MYKQPRANHAHRGPHAPDTQMEYDAHDARSTQSEHQHGGDARHHSKVRVARRTEAIGQIKKYLGAAAHDVVAMIREKLSLQGKIGSGKRQTEMPNVVILLLPKAFFVLLQDWRLVIDESPKGPYLQERLGYTVSSIWHNKMGG